MASKMIESYMSLLKFRKYLALFLSIIFLILWGLWAQPGTVAFRNFGLILGAIISSYVIWVNRPVFNLYPSKLLIAFILGLFLFIIIRLCIFPNDQNLQWYEFKSLWKRAILGVIFGIGLGLALIETPKIYLARLIYFGLLTPTILYWVKFIIGVSPQQISDLSLWALAQPHTRFYIPKIAYVFFCIPAFSVALKGVLNSLDAKKIHIFSVYFYIVSIVFILLIFARENIKNGFLYVVIISAFYLIKYLFQNNLKVSQKKCIFTILAISIIGASIVISVAENRSWVNFYADYKIASQVDRYQIWMNNGELPINENGEKVHGTNYDRVSWFIVGKRLVGQHPMGFGLVENSFGKLAQLTWPNTTVTQTHSGWLDVTLGLGIPGFLLIALTIIISYLALLRSKNLCAEYGASIILSIFLVFFTTELSQRIYIEALFLILGLASGLVAGNSKQQEVRKIIRG